MRTRSGKSYGDMENVEPMEVEPPDLEPPILRADVRHVFPLIANMLTPRELVLFSRTSKDVHHMCKMTPGIQIDIYIEVGAIYSQRDREYMMLIRLKNDPTVRFSTEEFASLLRQPFFRVVVKLLTISDTTYHRLQMVRRAVPMGTRIECVGFDGSVESWFSAKNFLTEYQVKMVHVEDTDYNRYLGALFQLSDAAIYLGEDSEELLSSDALINAKAQKILSWGPRISLETAIALLENWATTRDPLPTAFRFPYSFRDQLMIRAFQEYFTVDFLHSGRLPEDRPLFFSKRDNSFSRWILRGDGQVFRCAMVIDNSRKSFIRYSKVARPNYPPILTCSD